MAIAYAREGADVALSYLPEEQADAETTAEWVRQAGRRVLLLPGDIEPAQQCRDIVTAIVDAFGGIDILVNNAAISEGRTTIAEMDDAFWERTFAVNVHSLFYTTKAAAAVMEPGSVIIDTSSEAAKSPMPQSPLRRHQSCRDEHDPQPRPDADRPGHPRQCCPAGFDLDPAHRDRRRRRRTEAGRRCPDRRPAQPAELASSYVMLASDESSYLTGTLLAVSGGKSML